MKLRMIATSLLGLGLMAAPAFAAQPARPGTVNYVEGAAYIDGQPIAQNNVGNIALDAGQVLTTGAGKAEVLLTPGVFLRVNDNSAVKMVSPDLTLTQVEVDKGRAGVEVDEIHAQNNLQVIDAGVTTRLQKTGYYEFSANHPEVMVFKGKADVELTNGKGTEVKGNHDLQLAGAVDGALPAKEKAASLKGNGSEDDLYNWSRLRSQYLAEANNEMAAEYAGPGFYPGWYWDPTMFGYTFMGGGPFLSPFGWGFYPLGWGGGWYGGWGGYYGHAPYRFVGRGVAPRGSLEGGFHTMGGFHNMGGSVGGGFHGGGGSRGR